MVTIIEAAPPNSLILIEEIENGLHPIATQRMVEYLIEVAERKSVQAILQRIVTTQLHLCPMKQFGPASTASFAKENCRSKLFERFPGG